jgi:hypothetical protein
MEADRDNHKDRADAAEAKIKELEAKKLDSKEIDALVLARTELLANAAKAGVEVKADMAEVDVKKAVVAAIYPKVNFDSKDEVYVQARYDAAIESLDEAGLAGDREVLGGGSPLVAGERHDSAAARDKMIADLKARSRGEGVK